ncbi:MAG: DUF1294 domain-containing protein [Pirellula sp.]|jgi:uncharacterized membrane protein YsdA (DUF1294 family)|nr:DUF1294 domain-containing protein [Pirellula sp.]
MMTAVAIYLGIVLVMSLAGFAAYGWDKLSAANGSRRVPEQTLHFLALLGGWPGALLGQRHFRHKTKKLSFLIVFWCVVVLHVAMVGTVVYLFAGNERNLALEYTNNVKGYRANVKPIDGWKVAKA